MVRAIICALLISIGISGATPAAKTAVHLAEQAKKAQNSGQIVRAYLLYAEAAERDPHNPTYAIQRDALKPLAHMLQDANVESSPATVDEDESPNQVETLPEAADSARLAPRPHLQPQSGIESFDIRGDDKRILAQVAQRFGIEPIFDPTFDTGPQRRFAMDSVDFRTAMSGATAATNTFAFAISDKKIFIARDNETKRTEFEPLTVISVEVPDAVDQKDIVEAANAVRGAAGLRGTIQWSAATRTIVIRDRASRAEAAADLLRELVRPPAEVQFEVQLMTVDKDAVLQYGIGWQTTYQMLPLGLFTILHNPIPPTILNPVFLPFGGGASIVGIGLAETDLLAKYTKTESSTLFDAALRVSSGGTGSLHIGDKYPIPTALYSGAGSQANSGALYNPIGQVTQEDLGLALKVTPHVAWNGDVHLELEAEYKTLGSGDVDGVPTIAQRVFKGSLTLQEGQSVVVAGMREDDISNTKNGFPLLGRIPLLDILFTQQTKEKRSGDTLLVIKPQVLRLPPSDELRALLLGPHRGASTIF